MHSVAGMIVFLQHEVMIRWLALCGIKINSFERVSLLWQYAPNNMQIYSFEKIAQNPSMQLYCTITRRIQPRLC
jgi:hypothetical protein